ncbi:hypothetical protein C8R46DRAFT_892050 [Mycena filopes]|nr:hypothetical protein C8R46DRAFT_892050 [Mycena filopes]
MKDDLASAHELIAQQDRIIRQKEQRINRLIRDKAALTAKLTLSKEQVLDQLLRANAAEKLSRAESLRIEDQLHTISRLTTSVHSLRDKARHLKKTLRATDKREKRSKQNAATLRKELFTRKKWSAKKGHAFNAQYRTIALAATRAGCAQSRLGPLITRIGRMFGVHVSRSMSRRTVGRIITEAGIKVRLQLGHELAQAKAVTLSSDGTSHRNIKYESRHLTYAAPTYTNDSDTPQTAFRTRVVEVQHALDHTAQSQYEGWEVVSKIIEDTYSNSPLARRDKSEGLSFEADDMWRKMVAYNADHAADVKSTARKCTEKKALVAERDLGKSALESMGDTEVEDALWDVLQEIHDDPDGLDPKALPDDLRTQALQSLAAHLGSKALDDLTEHQRMLLTETIFGGCCHHKDHNCAKYGVTGMEAAWQRFKLTPPVLLANKDNAATIALGNDADSGAVERALKASQRGGYKLTSICGSLFRNKDDKKGHQDLHRHFFSKVKFNITGEHSTVKFPDTSNNRFGSHLAAAAELVTYHSAYIDFLSLIRDSKQVPGLNHSEQNAFNGLNDLATMTECCAMTLYKNAVSDPYVAATHKPGTNHIDLGPLHTQVIAHIEALIANPDLLLDPTTSCEEATLDGRPFRDQFAVDSVHFMAPRLPHLEQITVAFLEGTLPGWRRFTTEFSPDSMINSLTPAEKLLICIPPNSDLNESLLGGWRVHSRTRSASTISHFSAQEAYHRNDTESFSAAKLGTEEDDLYIMRLARMEDASGAMRKFRDDLLAFKQRAVEETRAKQKEKQDVAAARFAELKAITIITDAADLRKLNKTLLREQLDVRRELLKESVIAAKKLKDMKNKPDMLSAILASDERYVLPQCSHSC